VGVLRPLAGAAAAVAVLAACAGTSAAAADPATELAQRYAPVVRLVAQLEPCGHGEPYAPADVNVVLDDADVALRAPWGSGVVVKIGPTAADLSKRLTGYHLDFPGDALNPGCDYEKWSKAITPGTQPTTYARVVTEANAPGKLALQYWFFYVFNDFNDKHEGDWEMIQLDFDAGSAGAALGVHPYEVGYSQHTGAERAAWGDAKLRLVDGTHPIVYSALGSHANYFGSALHLGRSAAQGVGCDDTIGPSRDVRPVVAVVPTGQTAYLKAYPWLGFAGHWGEQHSGFYNGPTGPNTKEQWASPIAWAESEWRDKSYTVPEAGKFGVSATDFFCGAVAAGSNVLTAAVAQPGRVFAALGALTLLLIWLASRTRWDESAPFRIGRRRPWGSLVTAGLALYRSRFRLFLGIGLGFLPLGVLITALQYWLFRDGPLTGLIDSAGASNALVAGLALALGVFLTILGFTVVQAVVVLTMLELDDGRRPTPLEAYRLVRPRLWLLLGSLVRAAVVVTVLELTVLGFFVSIWLIVRWSMLAQVVALEERPAHPLRRSAALVRGHWWRVGSITTLVTGTALLIGPLIGCLLLFVSTASFDVVNLVSALVYIVVLPLAAIVQGYLYLDLRVREKLAPEETRVAAVLPAEI
jgi:hypothetical protein